MAFPQVAALFPSPIMMEGLLLQLIDLERGDLLFGKFLGGKKETLLNGSAFRYTFPSSPHHVYLERIVDGAETARIAVSKEGMDRINASTAAQTFRDVFVAFSLQVNSKL